LAHLKLESKTYISSQVRNLGMEIDNGLKFDWQIASVVGSSFFIFPLSL